MRELIGGVIEASLEADVGGQPVRPRNYHAQPNL